MVLAKNIKIRWRRRKNGSRRKINLKKGLFLLPHLFTFGNAFFGFCSLILATRGEVTAAAHFILLGALMDMLDGRIARLVGATSELGVQLDSLGDLISFCLAPAFLVYNGQLKDLGAIGVLISFAFFSAGMFRLARFNIIHQTQTLYFLGLPSTMAGCFLATVMLNISNPPSSLWQIYFYIALSLMLSYLMVSSLRFPAFKNRLFSEKRHLRFIVIALLFAIVAVLAVQQALLAFFVAYFIYAIRFMTKKEQIVGEMK